MKKVLIACERSGIVRDAFVANGINAVSCDLLPCDVPGNHIVGNVLDHLHGWDAIIAFPPCTHLSNAQPQKLLNEKIANGLTPAALNFIKTIWNACDVVCVENPISGYLNRQWMPYTQKIQPFHFGHNYRKTTCLWLKQLPPLMSTCWSFPAFNWVGGGANDHVNGKSQRTAKMRSQFHPGIAHAMAHQWKKYL